MRHLALTHALLLALVMLLSVGAEHAPSDVFDVNDTALNAALSGCGLCQQAGFCEHAFRGNPGQFCLTLLSGLPCCCPLDAQCVSNVYNCRCRRSVKVVTHTSSSSGGGSSVSLFTVLGIALCVICCLLALRNRDAQDEEVRYTQPVYTTPVQYGSTTHCPPKYAYGYPSAPPASPYYEGSTSSGLAAGAAGGVAGLAAGMMIGSAFGNHGRDETTTTTTTSYFGGDTGFDNTTSAFEFGGDTGDYGGDNGDFGGDS